MKSAAFFVPATLSILATLVNPALGITYCEVDGGTSMVHRVKVYADDIPDVPGICGGLWDNLNGFSSCGAVQEPSCGEDDGHPLAWEFVVGVGCNAGTIEAVWYEATKNEWGDLQCENK